MRPKGFFLIKIIIRVLIILVNSFSAGIVFMRQNLASTGVRFFTTIPQNFTLFYSTVSSGLNSLAAVTIQDFIRGYFWPDISESRATMLAKIMGKSECIGVHQR